MSRSRRRSLPAEPVTLDVTGLAHDGRGVARMQGKTVFIHGALPGEEVEARMTRRRRDFDEGLTVAVHTPAPERVEPLCEFYDRCGGCSLQHLGPAAQVQAKQRMVLDNLQRIGSVTPDTVLEPVTGPLWGYRRKARLGVKYVRGKGRVLVGFRERQSPYVADMLRCEILHPSVGDLLEPLSGLIGGLRIRERLPQIEVAIGDEVTALVMRVLDPPGPDDQAALLAFARTHDLDIYLQPGGPDSVYALVPEPRPLTYSLPGQAVTLAFEPLDFTQINHDINRELVGRALELLAPTEDERVLDLFCGLGNFTLPLARRACEVTGVEGDATLVARARANAAANDIGNAVFHASDIYDSAGLGDVPWLQGGYDAVLLDPPRSGAREVLPYLHGLGAERLVYVSCHPATLARDAGLLVHDHGYRLTHVGVLDMFPHTSHVETIARFER